MKYKYDKDQIVYNFLPKIKAIAINLVSTLPKNIDLEDLIQEGVIGLLQSYDRYDPSKKVTFYTYSMSRIKGAMIDYLRKIDWLPKEVRHLVKKYENFIANSPEDKVFSDDEIIETLNITREELFKIKIALKKSQILELDYYLFEKGEQMQNSNEADENDPELLAYKDILKKRLKDKINNLKEKEKIILSLYYEKELTFKEIGKILNLGESRISQIHSNILIKLKKDLEGDD